MSASSAASHTFRVRISRTEHATLKAAAALSRTALNEFIRRAALEAAEAELLSRSGIAVSDANWVAFQRWIRRPAEPVPALIELARRRPTWDDHRIKVPPTQGC